MFSLFHLPGTKLRVVGESSPSSFAVSHWDEPGAIFPNLTRLTSGFTHPTSPPTSPFSNSSCSSEEQKKSPNPPWADLLKQIQPGSRRKGFLSALLPETLAQPDVEKSGFSTPMNWETVALQIFVGGISVLQGFGFF